MPRSAGKNGIQLKIFGLTNAANQIEFLKIHSMAVAGKMDRETYAKENERTEYQGSLLRHKIVAAAILELGWDPSMDRYKSLDGDFEKYWQASKGFSHTEYYRRCWDDIRKANPISAAAASI